MERILFSNRCPGEPNWPQQNPSSHLLAGPPEPEGQWGLHPLQLWGLQARSCSGPSECREPWSGEALGAPSQLQSGLKSIFHSTAPKSPRKPVPFRPPWARWGGGGEKGLKGDRTLQPFLSWMTQDQKTLGFPTLYLITLSTLSLPAFSGSLLLPMMLSRTPNPVPVSVTFHLLLPLST